MDADRNKNFSCFLICLDEVPADFSRMDSENNMGAYAINVLDTFVFLANLHNHHELLFKIEDAINQSHTASPESRIYLSLLDEIQKYIDMPYAEFIASTAYLEYRKIKKKRKNAFTDTMFQTACMIAAKYANALVNPEPKTPEGLGGGDFIYAMIGSMDDMGMGLDIRYHPMYGYSGDKFTFLNAIIPMDFVSVVNIAALTLLKDECVVRKCRNCGSYFIPSSRSDEIYCDRRLPNGKTCKTLGYDTKIKDNEILREYRKIYKTQNARKQRNSKNKPDISIKFQRWVEFAKNEVLKCQQNKISFQEMVDAISKDDWMY